MGQGIDGIVDDISSADEIPQEVFEFHRRYREFLDHCLKGYVFDNEGKNVYLDVCEGCDEEMLREVAKRFDYSFGILHGNGDVLRKLGRYKSLDEMDHDIQRCA